MAPAGAALLAALGLGAAPCAGAVALIQGALRVAGGEDMLAGHLEGRPRHRQAQHGEVRAEGPLVSERMSVFGFGHADEEPALGAVPEPAPAVLASAAPRPAAVLRERTSADRQASQQETAAAFSVGETVEVLDLSRGGFDWVSCSITGAGGSPGTYDIHVPEAPEGRRDYADVATKYLRRPDPKDLPGYGAEAKSSAGNLGVAQNMSLMKELNSTRLLDYWRSIAQQRAAAVTFEENEPVEIRVAKGSLAGSWIPCVITGRGVKENTYNVHVPGAQKDFEYIPNVHVAALRKVERKPAGPETAPEAVPGGAVKAAPEASTEAVPEDSFEDSPEAMPEAVLEAVPEAAPEAPAQLEARSVAGGEEWSMQPSEPAAGMELPRAFGVGEMAELQVTHGPHAGDWIKVSITSAGSQPDTYNLSTGFEDVHDVPITSLRKSAAGEW